MKRLILAVTLLVFTGSIAMAQGGQRRTVEERVKAVHDKFVEVFKLDAAKLTQTDTIFTKYYKGSDKIREEMTAGGAQPDFQAFREKLQPLVDERDKELKPILGDDNYKKWKDEVEASLRRRPQN